VKIDDGKLNSQEEQNGDGYINMTSPKHKTMIPSHSGTLKPYSLTISRAPNGTVLLLCQAKYF